MSVKYFSQLNYSLGNEDTELEYKLVRHFKSEHIVSVCGSGSRCFPLVHETSKTLHIVDLVAEQLELAQLRLELIKKLEHTEFLKYWGYAPHNLKEDNDSILYIGKWEKTFKRFSQLVKIVLGKHAGHLFTFDDLNLQRAYFANEFPWRRWNLLVRIIGNKAIFNALLYKGDFVKKNINETYYDYYQKAFKHLFYHDLAKKSFFLQLCMQGEILYPEGNLIEAQSECYTEVKKNIAKTQVQFYQQEIISVLKNLKSIDFVSLSDVPSYFSGELEQNFLQLIKPSLAKGAIVVLRSYLRIPNANQNGFQDISEDFKDLIAAEKVAMYRIQILRLT
jgi:S-adenosylmethionine-diacylglycerol 3-amino-3-carboxypropyl transferase